MKSNLLWLCLLTVSTQWLRADEAIRRYRTQPQLGRSLAVRVTGRSLLHTRQIAPAQSQQLDEDNLAAHFDSMMEQLQRVLTHAGAARRDIVKLNVYVTSVDAANLVRSRLSKWFGDDLLPAVSYVQTPLPNGTATMALDAVVAVAPITGARPVQVQITPRDPSQSSYSVSPLGDVVYIAGQAQKGTLAEATSATLHGLLKTLKHVGLGREHIAELKCFLDPISDVDEVDERIGMFFENDPVPPVSHVRWIAGSLPIEIELIAYAPKANSADTVEIITPPWMRASPVFSRITRLSGDSRIYLSGLYGNAGDDASQVRDIFASMRTVLAETGGDLRHLAKATYYVSTPAASASLNSIRPEIYDPSRPPAASKAMVDGVAKTARSVSIDMIAAPNPTIDSTVIKVATRIVEDSSIGDFREHRRMITGPGVNEHPPYPGCTGFVGWESVTRLGQNNLICSFSAGYWHVSFPSPIDIEPKTLKSYQASGFPLSVDAPTGGRALITRSADGGRNWTQPTTLVDTPGDDRHPVIVRHPDGTLVCNFFVIDNWYGYDRPPPGRNKNSRVASIHSNDGGATWSEPIYMPSPFDYYDRMCGKPIILDNGDILLSTYGKEHWRAAEELGLYVSSDSGKSWRFQTRLQGSIGALDEPAIAKTQSGRLVTITRPNGEISFSFDRGRHWTTPRPFGIKMVAPCLLTLSDGTLVCIFGWGSTGGLQIIWSDDGGERWTVPAHDRGFSIDSSVYVYGIGTEMPDNSIYVVYYDPAAKQRKTAIWGLRLRIKDDRRGIEFLPPD